MWNKSSAHHLVLAVWAQGARHSFCDSVKTSGFQKDLDNFLPFFKNFCFIAPHNDIINVLQVLQSFIPLQCSLSKSTADGRAVFLPLGQWISRVLHAPPSESRLQPAFCFKGIDKNALTSVQKYVYKHTLTWYHLNIYLVHYVFRINDKNVNSEVSKAGHKSLALPLKCLEGFQSLIQEADSHFNYEETANRRHQRGCMFNSLQHLQKSQSKMPRFFWSFCLQMLNITDLTESGTLKPAMRNPINTV